MPVTEAQKHVFNHEGEATQALGIVGKEVRVTDGTDYDAAEPFDCMKLDVAGFVELDLADSTDTRSYYAAGVWHPMHVTKIYYTTGANGNTEAALGISLGKRDV